ncbi:HEPN domain-containing protein [Pseudoxanthomonas mexicana]|uniref:ApeA N-terminal domain 1-containing protein n=1 Tax=Pseudoxanthomonas mexicana TaxID=128785 RepID=UPI0028A88FC3|nr:HEPN domain-containing protein [Pseudoxanthomonas mexicana]
MKLDFPQVLEGHFWLPGEDERVSGRLKISEEGKCSLDLLGLFGGYRSAFSEPTKSLTTIHGIVEGGLVTLYDCFYLNQNFGFGTVAVSKVHVSTVIRGANLPPEEILRFTKLEAVVSGLDEWLQISGIESGFEIDSDNKVKSAFIRYVPPPRIVIATDELLIAFEFAWTAPGGGGRTEAKITHQARLSVTPTSASSLDDIRRQLGRVVNFLSFAADRTLTVDALYAYSDSAILTTDNQNRAVQLCVFYESSSPASKGSPDAGSMLFTYPEISDRIQVMLSTWLDQHASLSPAFNLYFSVQSGRHTYVESAFLSIIQGIETLHDRTSNETVEPADVFDRRVASILASCPDEARDWLVEQLAYANKPSLRTRLRRMLKPFSSHFGNAEVRKDLVDRVVDTRNYLTHYDPSLAERAATGRELYELTSKLRALFQLHLLVLVGIETRTIERIITSNRHLRYRLGLITS